MALAPPKARPSSPATSAMVDAWSDGKVSTSGHKAMAAAGYRTGLHEGMRMVVELLEQGHDLAHVVDRCRARITGKADRAAGEHASYWLAKAASISQAEPAIAGHNTHSDHGADFVKQHMD